jgi:hypothetical protein
MKPKIRTRTVVWMFAAISVSGAVPAVAQTDPLIGTWVLNVAKSRYPTGRAPASQTVTFEQAGDATRMISEIVDSEGKTTRREYTAKNDGKDYPFPGSTSADTVALRRIDARTFERIDKKNGKVVSTLVRTLAPDGKSFSVKSRDASGRESGTVAVYELKPGSRKGS